MLRNARIDWEAVRRKADSLPWAQDITAKMRTDFAGFRAAWPQTPPTEPSAWYHYYFCEKCGVKLDFDLASPKEHPCPVCGRVYTGEPYDGAWRKQVHWAEVAAMQQAATLCHIDPENPVYPAFLRQTLLFYAENYASYAVHGKHAGKGKVFPQALTEAIFLIDMEELLAQTADLSLFTDDELTCIAEKLFRPGLALISSQQDDMPMPHNIQMWYQTCRIACASFLDDKETLRDAVSGPHGWLRHVEQGLTGDGFWYELSLTYHYYTFSALLRAARVLLCYPEYENTVFHPAFRRMADAYLPLGYPDGSLPAMNDSWYGGTLGSLQNACESLWRFFPEYEGELSTLLQMLPNASRGGMDALLYGPETLPPPSPLTKESRLFADTGLVLLQDEQTRLLLKNTGDGGGHDHNDQTSLEIFYRGEKLSWDPGTAGYGCAFTSEWLRSPYAHNLFIRGEQRQPRTPHGEVILQGNTAKAVSAAVPGAVLERQVSLLCDGWLDRYAFRQQTPARWDWVFHIAGDLEADFPLEEETLSEQAPFSYLQTPRAAMVDAPFTLLCRTKTQTLRLHIQCSAPARLVLARCPAQDARTQVSCLLLRFEAATAEVALHAEGV